MSCKRKFKSYETEFFQTKGFIKRRQLNNKNINLNFTLVSFKKF